MGVGAMLWPYQALIALAGIGPLAAGDVVTVRVSGVGDLVNPVIAG